MAPSSYSWPCCVNSQPASRPNFRPLGFFTLLFTILRCLFDCWSVVFFVFFFCVACVAVSSMHLEHNIHVCFSEDDFWLSGTETTACLISAKTLSGRFFFGVSFFLVLFTLLLFSSWLLQTQTRIRYPRTELAALNDQTKLTNQFRTNLQDRLEECKKLLTPVFRVVAVTLGTHFLGEFWPRNLQQETTNVGWPRTSSLRWGWRIAGSTSTGESFEAKAMKFISRLLIRVSCVAKRLAIRYYLFRSREGGGPPTFGQHGPYRRFSWRTYPFQKTKRSQKRDIFKINNERSAPFSPPPPPPTHTHTHTHAHTHTHTHLLTFPPPPPFHNALQAPCFYAEFWEYSLLSLPSHIYKNYSPKWRWIAVDIYRAASAR